MSDLEWKQQRRIKEAIAETLDADAIADAIVKECTPGQVFSVEDLRAWAKENGFTADTDMDDWALENGYTKAEEA